MQRIHLERIVLVGINLVVVCAIVLSQHLLTGVGAQDQTPDRVEFSWGAESASHIVELPHDWRSEPLSSERQSGQYRLSFSVDEIPTNMWAIYLPQHRFVANLTLNDGWIGATGRTTTPISRRHFTPDLVAIPSSVLQEGRNVLVLEIVSDPPGLGFLAPVEIGPYDNLLAKRARAYWISITLTQVAAAAILVLGMVLLVLWRAKVQDRSYAYFGSVCVVWPVHMSNRFLTDPPMTAAAWEYIVFLAAFWMAIFGLLFAVRLARSRLSNFERHIAIGGVVVSLLFHSMPFDLFMYWAQVGLTPLTVLLTLLGTAILGMYAWQHRRRHALLLSILCTAVTTTALLDTSMLLAPADGMIVFMHQYMAFFAIGGVGAILIRQFIHSSRTVRTLNQNLEGQLRQKEQELAHAFEKMRDADRNAAAHDERTRMMGELHDGLGAHLASLLHVAKHHKSDALVVSSIEGALRELRFLAGPLRWSNADISSLLGSFREHRLRHLEAAGLRVVWRVGDVSSDLSLSAAQSAHFLRILDEVLANVLKHSIDKEIVVELTEQEGAVELKLCNPYAEDPELSAGEGVGLTTIANRAALIGAMHFCGGGDDSFCHVFQWETK